MIDPEEFRAEKAAIVAMFQEAREEVLRRQALTEEEQVADTIPPPPPTMPAPPDKACACGRVHDVYDWVRLPFVGIMSDDVDRLELRNCECNSTLAIEAWR